MKKIYIVSVQPDPDGPVFGRGLDPTDFMKAQDFEHDHIQRVTKDLLVSGAAGAQVAGLAATRTSGLSVSVAKGDAVDENGVCYETDQADDGSSLVTMVAAHVSLPRIDLIIATLSIDTPVGSEFKPFRRLRTSAELEARLDPYPETQFDGPTELHTRAVISVKTGVPNASPAAPVAGAGEVPLWQIHVAAGQVTLGGGDLTDVRPLMKSLYQVVVDLAAANVFIAALNAGAELLAHKGQVDGYASLDGAGKVPSTQLPSIVISDVFEAASQAAMLALAASVGDMAIRSDVNQTFVLSAAPATTLGNWKQLLFPSPVTSFNGRLGAVGLLLADITAGLGFTPVNKAGDAMSGQLSITQPVNFVPVLDLIGTNAAQGIRLNLAAALMLLDLQVGGVSVVKFDAFSGSPIATFTKALNGMYLVEITNAGGAAWGIHVVMGSSSTEPVLHVETVAGDIFNLQANGLVALGHGNPDMSGSGKVHMGGDSFRLQTSRSPASNGTGRAGEFCWDTNFFYVCVATNTWKRVALTGGY